MTTCSVEPFGLSWVSSGRLSGPCVSAGRAILERLLCFPALNAYYNESRRHSGSFAQRALDTLGVTLEFNNDDLHRVPKSGPLVVVANHPFGGLDGLVLAALLERVRPDARLLVNFLLGRIPDMQPYSFFVDPFGDAAARSRNRRTLKSAVQWVREGGALGVFPAGEVSHFTVKNRCVTDPPWSDTVARIVRRTKASVLPVFFEGCNGRAFQLAGLVHPRLRTALLPRELLARRGSTIRVELGGAIPFERLCNAASVNPKCRGLSDDEAGAVTEYLRLRTYILRGRIASARRAAEREAAAGAARRNDVPVGPSQPVEAIEREIAALPLERCLATNGPFRVLYAVADEIPAALREIGRLREMTFRAVGEGTGRAIDLDRFDAHYLHLFAWHQERRQIVGAYRIGQTDEILQRLGVRGLYTSTLFDFKRRLLDQLDPALELGRSFVVPEYQRDFAPLMLLWKGIGRFVAMHPRYRRLFGAVSISDEFASMTKQLLMGFLRANCFDEQLGELVRAKNPPRIAPPRDVDPRRLAALVGDVTDVEELVGEIESGRKGVPVLLRQYLRLNAKVLGFNIDPDFGDVIDGLVLADLTTVERPILDRYMGRDPAAGFLACHRKQA